MTKNSTGPKQGRPGNRTESAKIIRFPMLMDNRGQISINSNGDGSYSASVEGEYADDHFLAIRALSSLIASLTESGAARQASAAILTLAARRCA